MTYAHCSSAGKVVAFSCLPRKGREWVWCLVREFLPYWARSMKAIGAGGRGLGMMPELWWSEPHETLSEVWVAVRRLAEIRAGRSG